MLILLVGTAMLHMGQESWASRVPVRSKSSLYFQMLRRPPNTHKLLILLRSVPLDKLSKGTLISRNAFMHRPIANVASEVLHFTG